MKQSEKLRNEILKKVKDYYFHTQVEKEAQSKVQYAGRVYNHEELINLVDSALDFQLTSGKYCSQFESKFSSMFNIKYSYCVNSGSSANLLAFLSLTSDKLGDRKINRWDEVITIAYAFPTTISPIIQYGAIPVFVDIKFDNIDEAQLENALSGKTKAVFVAHTLGNPFNVKAVKDFCDKHNLWLIQDSCDSLGAKYDGKNIEEYGDIITYSFYPAHHITCGQGGMVATNCPILSKIIRSMKEWGRDYKCDVCKGDCLKRYDFNGDEKLKDYDCRYTYSHFGLNVAATEMQASISLAQLGKLQFFLQKRQENFDRLWDNLKNLQEYFILPKVTENSEPSHFAFLLTLQKDVPFKRVDIVKYLEKNNIETRMLFAGNILYQECSKHLRKGLDYRIVGELKNTDYMANNSFFIGVYPGLNKEDIDYMSKIIKEFISGLH